WYSGVCLQPWGGPTTGLGGSRGRLLRRWGNRRGPRVGDGSYLGCKTGTLAAQAVVIASRTNELSGDATGVKDHLLLLGRKLTKVRGALLGAQYRRGDLRESEGTNRGKHGRAQVYRHWLRG